MTPDLRPEALLALAKQLEQMPHMRVPDVFDVADAAAATLRALAALPQRCAELEQLLKVMERQYADALLYRKGE
jgi:HPt (histidine-containing phosphotransfer) domain-containing protein